MQITPIQVVTLVVSSLVLLVSVWNLYLSHYKESRSDVQILDQDPEAEPEFAGGNGAIDESARWKGHFNLNVVNNGEKSATVSAFDHRIKGFWKNSEPVDTQDISLEVNEHRPSWIGNELEPHSSQRYRGSATITPSDSVEPFIENDAVVIEHSLTVADNQGSYTVNHETEMQLTGHEHVLENWAESQN